jgi:anti-sigma B factor antagonist
MENRRVGDATVVTCTGRLIAGAEAMALQNQLEELMPRTRHIVLHLGAVDSIDSGGLGLLVRYLMRGRRSSVSLSICAVSPKIDEVLRITKLKSVFPPYVDEADAITDVHADFGDPNQTTVLCAAASSDVTAYLRELLRVAGYRAISAQTLPDALTLLIATRPKVVVLSAEFAEFKETRTAQDFHQLAAGRVVTLPAGFSQQDAGEAAGDVLRAVGAAC